MMTKLYNPEESVLDQGSTLPMIAVSSSRAPDGTCYLEMAKTDLVLAWADSMRSPSESLSDLASTKIEIK
jgi:hypothetical protein